MISSNNFYEGDASPVYQLLTPMQLTIDGNSACISLLQRMLMSDVRKQWRESPSELELTFVFTFVMFTTCLHLSLCYE